jgi:hypothetical protein
MGKGWFKEAVKQGKMCFRQESTPEHHRLLERAYFLWSQELHCGAMLASAAEVARHLLEFGVTDPEISADLAPLMSAVGEPILDRLEQLSRLVREGS